MKQFILLRLYDSLKTSWYLNSKSYLSLICTVIWHDIIMWCSSCTSLHTQNLASRGIYAPLPVSIRNLCDDRRKRVKEILYISGTNVLEFYLLCVVNWGFRVKYVLYLVVSYYIILLAELAAALVTELSIP